MWVTFDRFNRTLCGIPPPHHYYLYFESVRMYWNYNWIKWVINRVSGVQQERDHVHRLFNDFRLAVYQNNRTVRYSAGPVTRRRDFRAARINHGRRQVNCIITKIYRNNFILALRARKHGRNSDNSMPPHLLQNRFKIFFFFVFIKFLATIIIIEFP